MKSWLGGTLLITTGMFFAGLIWIIAAPPRGQTVMLLPPPTPAPLLIHVSGAVSSPGVYELPQNARVRDALDIAGGLTKEANTTGLNLAALLTDGAQVNVAFEVVAVEPESVSPLPASGVTTATPAPTNAPPIAADDLINLNTASVEELDTLPGIGPAIAQRIIDYREANGNFASIQDITNVSGIGPSTFSKIENMITVSP